MTPFSTHAPGEPPPRSEPSPRSEPAPRSEPSPRRSPGVRADGTDLPGAFDSLSHAFEALARGRPDLDEAKRHLEAASLRLSASVPVLAPEPGESAAREAAEGLESVHQDLQRAME